MDCVLALDQGTSSSRALLYDAAGRVVAAEQVSIATHAPQPGWAEQDAEQIWTTSRDAARRVLARCASDDRIVGLGIANQRETVVVWDRETLRPIGPAISWQCRRTAEACAALAASHGDVVRTRTGLMPDPYFSGPKIAWLLDHLPDARRRAERGELVAGTVDAWLFARLTGGAVHATEPTNASRTMLWDIHRGAWDEELCAAQGVPPSMLPEVRPSLGPFAVSEEAALGRALPVLAMAGDQQAALVGQGCFGAGSMKVTYGTGAFPLVHTDGTAVGPSAGLLTTRAVALPGEAARFALEGSVFSAGSAVDWLAAMLGLDGGAVLSDLAAGAGDSGGVSIVPALAGLGAPHWQPGARSLISGVSAATRRSHLARALLEGIAFRVREVLDAAERAMGKPIGEVRVDGRLSASDVLMQIQAAALQRPVVRPADLETTARGAARMAAIAAGIWDPTSMPTGEEETRFLPAAELETEFDRWQRARAAAIELGRASR